WTGPARRHPNPPLPPITAFRGRCPLWSGRVSGMGRSRTRRVWVESRHGKFGSKADIGQFTVGRAHSRHRSPRNERGPFQAAISLRHPTRQRAGSRGAACPVAAPNLRVTRDFPVLPHGGALQFIPLRATDLVLAGL